MTERPHIHKISKLAVSFTIPLKPNTLCRNLHRQFSQLNRSFEVWSSSGAVYNVRVSRLPNIHKPPDKFFYICTNSLAKNRQSSNPYEELDNMSEHRNRKYRQSDRMDIFVQTIKKPPTYLNV